MFVPHLLLFPLLLVLGAYPYPFPGMPALAVVAWLFHAFGALFPDMLPVNVYTDLVLLPLLSRLIDLPR